MSPSGTDIDPAPVKIDLTLTLNLEADHRLLGHVIGVHLAGIARLQRQHMHTLCLEAVAGPGDQTRRHPMRLDLDSLVEISDGPALTDLLARAVSLPVRFGVHDHFLQRNSAR